MPEEPPAFQIREPSGVEALLPGWWLPPVLLAVFLLLVIGILAFLLIRLKNRKRVEDPAKLREAARLEAVAALNNAPKSTSREAAITASLILRRYLAAATGDPALFETHEEFVARRDSLASLSPTAREAAATGFASLATLKYGVAPPEAAPVRVLEDARNLLDQLHNGFAPPTPPPAANPAIA